jgi:hypothetical protein
MDSTRAEALTQIFLIENKVRQISNSQRYRMIQQSVLDLKNISGRSIIEVENPADFGNTVQVRKNSKIAKEYLETYEALLKEYEIQFMELNERKKTYKARLFGPHQRD